MTKLASAALALLALAATAGATVRVFVTASSSGYGLEDPAEHMTPTISTVYANGLDENGYDYIDYYGAPGPLRPGAYPPYEAPSGTADDAVQVPAGDWAYIWLQFQNEPKGAAIVGLQTAVLESGVTWDPNDPVLPAGISTTYYLCNNVNRYPLSVKRWNGTATPPDYPEWHNNPQSMTASGEDEAIGIWNASAAQPHNLYYNLTRTALLGAVEAPADGRTYQVLITSVTYYNLPAPTVSAGYFQFLRAPCVGDLNCDGLVDFGDINPFVLYLSNESAWQATYPTCPAVNGDIDADGTYGQWSFGDINPFVALMTQAPFACP